MDFGHGGAMVEPSRGFFVHFTRTTEVTSLSQNRLGKSRAALPAAHLLHQGLPYPAQSPKTTIASSLPGQFDAGA